jgi:hypothetical protein
MRRLRIIGVVLVLLYCDSFVTAQRGRGYLETKGRVLDLVFPTDGDREPYYRKLVLRFEDSDSQITVLIHYGGGAEVIRYSLKGLDDSKFSRLIMDMVDETSPITEQELAAKLKIDTIRSRVDEKAVKGALKELQALRISPVLATRRCVDGCSRYEFWDDTGQESVHYILCGRLNKYPADKLVQWMVNFRERLPSMIDSSAASNTQAAVP